MEPELVVHPIRWNLAPTAGENHWARNWLTFQSNRGLAPNTLEAYVRAIEIYFAFLAKQNVRMEDATRVEIGAYIKLFVPAASGVVKRHCPAANHDCPSVLCVPCRGRCLLAQPSAESLTRRAKPRSPASAPSMDSD
jgi:hypothetical protein